MEEFVAWKPVQGRKSLWRKQVKYRCANEALPCVCRADNVVGNLQLRAIRFGEIAAFDRVRLQVEYIADIIGGQRRHSVSQIANLSKACAYAECCPAVLRIIAQLGEADECGQDLRSGLRRASALDEAWLRAGNLRISSV